VGCGELPSTVRVVSSLRQGAAAIQSVKWNRLTWDVDYSWADGGDSWSEQWGGPEKQWRGTILPRIRDFVPARTCLEIAPGHGRWTQFLKDLCDQLFVVDLSASCIAACQQRFSNCANIRYYVNDGTSLAMVPDQSVDFAFSFDSLVHVEADVIEAYLQQLASKLTKEGVGFIHHSNLGQYKRQFWYRRVPLLRSIVKRTGLVDTYTGYRTLSVTAAKFEEIARRTGLQCISQELVNWNSPRLTDCLSVFTPNGSRWFRPNQIRHNPHFMDEARRIRETCP
jgi:Methyltransferase domain